MTRRRRLTGIALLGAATLGAAAQDTVRPWKPVGISSPRFESHPAFDLRSGDFYFVRSSPHFTEIGAVFSPSGRSLLFARDTKGPDSGEFFVWYEHGPETWSPDCPG